MLHTLKGARESLKVGSYDENSPYLWYCFLYQSYGEKFHFFSSFIQ
jgi:hypothetical protein